MSNQRPPHGKDSQNAEISTGASKTNERSLERFRSEMLARQSVQTPLLSPRLLLTQFAERFRAHARRWKIRFQKMHTLWWNTGTRSLFSAIHGKIRKRLRGKTGVGSASYQELYEQWYQRHEPDAEALQAQRATRFRYHPLISIAVPTYNCSIPFLLELIDSVRDQTYPHWELCIADGGSKDPAVREVLDRYAASDPRIRVEYLPKNLGISGNSNAALDMANGEWVGLLDHDDTLAPFALHEVVRVLQEHSDIDLIYSDEDKLDPNGRRCMPTFKPAFSPDYLRTNNYICHFSVYRTRLVRELGGFRSGFDGAQDLDLVLRAAEVCRKIVHIPQILYHWRIHEQSTAADVGAKPYAVIAGRRAIEEHLQRNQQTGSVIDSPYAVYQVKYDLPRQPLVSILIPNHDQADRLERCIASIERSTYQNFEILILENHSTDPRTHELYARLQQRSNIRVLTWHEPFNFSAINNWGAKQGRGEVLLFLNNDTEVIASDWLERMLEHALRERVGVVGALLLYPGSRRIQHAGMVLGMDGFIGHRFHGITYLQGFEGDIGRVRNVSAVTGACMMIRRDLFEQLGGFDERLVMTCNDVDLCLKARDRDYLVLMTPHAMLYHDESLTRGPEDSLEKWCLYRKEMAMMQARWKQFFSVPDPYYNPNLTLERTDETPAPDRPLGEARIVVPRFREPVARRDAA